MSTEGLTGPPEQLAGGVILLPLAGSRADAAASAVECLRADGLHTIIGSGFEDFDARILGSRLVAGDLITSAHPEGSLQLRVRPRLRTWWYTMVAVVAVALAAFSPILMAVVLILAALDAAIGLWRVGPKARRAIARGAGG